jgi:hypothetical protein
MMAMKSPFQKPDRAGSALTLTLIMTGIAFAILAAAMSWSANTTRLTHRSIQYARTVVAAEAATEKVLSSISQDFLHGGEKLVADNLNDYRAMVPNSADSSTWSQWQFTSPDRYGGATHVQRGLGSNYVVLNSTYAGLRGYVTSFTVVSHAREANALQDVVAGVLQEVQLARIPVFQFAMYSSGDMEISCGQPFNVTGRVHSNKELYVEPDSVLTFQSDVTAVNSILFERHPLDTRSAPGGSAVYQARKDSHIGAMSLPIGTTNTPEAIREIIQPPPFGEDPNSPIGRLRYYNQSDMILVVSNTGISATSVKFNGLQMAIPPGELGAFVNTTNSFHDAREGKTVQAIDINVGLLAEWSRTNNSARPAIGSRDVASVYVLDRRTLPGTSLGAVRVHNGLQLPPDGLTIATARPLYVLGHYNQTNNAHLGTTNTTATRPASLIADAITVLSTAWLDSRSTQSLSSRTAAPTTVNAAILTGAVDTTLGKYSGGMENFPRFLERWGSANTFTYNGSMVKMFPSVYATNAWNNNSGIYEPPKRNWAFDVNFNDPSKLPPLTPSLQKVIRGRWDTVAPVKNVSVVNSD